MITVSTTNGDALVHPDHIVTVTKAGDSSAWHGIHTYIRTDDGRTLECRDSFERVQLAIKTWYEVRSNDQQAD